MTEIQERRWRCDYCGNVSPVLVLGDLYPKGWVEIARGAHENGYVVDNKHFCCTMHETLYKNKRAESAETPEEANA